MRGRGRYAEANTIEDGILRIPSCIHSMDGLHLYEVSRALSTAELEAILGIEVFHRKVERAYPQSEVYLRSSSNFMARPH